MLGCPWSLGYLICFLHSPIKLLTYCNSHLIYSFCNLPPRFIFFTFLNTSFIRVNVRLTTCTFASEKFLFLLFLSSCHAFQSLYITLWALLNANELCLTCPLCFIANFIKWFTVNVMYQLKGVIMMKIRRVFCLWLQLKYCNKSPIF